jgi:CDP-glucose 4,6-dehydratase
VIRSDGQFTRDYIYVEDAVDGYLSLAETMASSDEVRGEAFNFSCERPLKVIELADMILSTMEREDLEPIVQGEATNEIRDQFLSAAKARELIGWRPRFGLEDGLVRTVDWYRRALTPAG